MRASFIFQVAFVAASCASVLSLPVIEERNQLREDVSNLLELESGKQGCCRNCLQGKACGNSCIEKADVCGLAPGCACNLHGLVDLVPTSTCGRISAVALSSLKDKKCTKATCREHAESQVLQERFAVIKATLSAFQNEAVYAAIHGEVKASSAAKTSVSDRLDAIHAAMVGHCDRVDALERANYAKWCPDADCVPDVADREEAEATVQAEADALVAAAEASIRAEAAGLLAAARDERAEVDSSEALEKSEEAEAEAISSIGKAAVSRAERAQRTADRASQSAEARTAEAAEARIEERLESMEKEREKTAEESIQKALKAHAKADKAGRKWGSSPFGKESAKEAEAFSKSAKEADLADAAAAVDEATHCIPIAKRAYSECGQPCPAGQAAVGSRRCGQAFWWSETLCESTEQVCAAARTMDQRTCSWTGCKAGGCPHGAVRLSYSLCWNMVSNDHCCS